MVADPAGDPDVDVLVVGAGPTGLALAAELRSYDVRFRVVDRLWDRVHESRALAIQPRTLEVLAARGVSDRLVARGNRSPRVRLHLGGRVTEVPLFDIGLDDTRYPFLLFLSQAETESVLGDHLALRGVAVERGVELVALEPGPESVTCRLRHGTGAVETVRARYVAGCDGPHSTVRHLAGIPFHGAAYPQAFVLADLEADALDPTCVHGFVTDDGPVLFFPLVRPATWRMIAMRSADGSRADDDVMLADLQRLADAATGGTVRLHDPLWTAGFRLHRRSAEHLRSGRVFLAGDAAHIHSPAGAQGMNTGIQDAANLAWKLALVATGRGSPALLDTYEAERAPVGRAVLRLSDRGFRAATSRHPVVRLVRTRAAPFLLGAVTHAHAGRALAFRTLAQLRIHYRDSPLSAPARPARGPRPGDRLPDALVLVRGRTLTLHHWVRPPGFHLLLWDPQGTCPRSVVAAVTQRYGDVVTVHMLGPRRSGAKVQDLAGQVARRLRLPAERPAHLLVRPDGHIALRGGADLRGLRDHLETWLVPTA